jgi:hypothetical protein
LSLLLNSTKGSKWPQHVNIDPNVARSLDRFVPACLVPACLVPACLVPACLVPNASQACLQPEPREVRLDTEIQMIKVKKMP